MPEYQPTDLLTRCSPIMGCPSVAGCDSSIFTSVNIVPRITGGTVVSWRVGPNTLVGPIQFRLEVDRVGLASADDWTPVTEFAPDINTATDAVYRSSGWYRSTYYRVAAMAADDTVVYSKPIPANQGRMNQTQTRLYNEIVRREQKRYYLKQSPSSPGYLLKVRYYGAKCTVCLDVDSGEPTNNNCPNCFGIGYEHGYFDPHPCFNVDITPAASNLAMYKDQGPIVEGGIVSLRYLNIPPVHPWDVWVDGISDYRYMIGQITPIAAFGDLEVVCAAAAGRLAFDHPVYRIDMP